VIDAGKAIAALATNCGPAVEYLEVIGQGRPLAKDPLPYIAVPTTAGTGAEVTRNAVLASKEHEVKVSLRSAKMLPAVALVDPELTYGLPPAITANTGLDALTQLIEAFVCLRANALTDGLCREAIPRVAKALPVAFHNGQSVAARGEMALGSLFGGLALANAGLGVVHGFAAPIGGMFEAPHGGICAALLPGALAVNLRAVRKRAKAGMERFAELAFLVTGEKGAGCERLVEWTSNLTRALQVPGLRVYGVEAKDCDVLCERASRASSMKANPVELTREELREVVGMAL
jgi:alcohol dehydrogenase class IV